MSKLAAITATISQIGAVLRLSQVNAVGGNMNSTVNVTYGQTKFLPYFKLTLLIKCKEFKL